jgi:hypothetical protein
MVDRQFGNVFKMDRHSHVGRCYHGFRKLSREERRDIYRSERMHFASTAYAWIDTLFGLPEAVMYLSLVEYFDKVRGPARAARGSASASTASPARSRTWPRRTRRRGRGIRIDRRGGRWEQIEGRPGERMDEFLIGDLELPYTREVDYGGVNHFVISFNEEVDDPVKVGLSSANAERLTEDEIVAILDHPPEEA